MSKKKSKKKFAVEAPRVFPFRTKHRGKIILGIILFLVLLFLVVHQVQIMQEKADYRQAETKLEQLYRQIEAKIGKPDGIERKKSCGYSSAKFSKGILSCSVSVLFSQSVDDVGTANTKANHIVDILKQDNKLTVGDYNRDQNVDFLREEPYIESGQTSRYFDILGNTRSCSIHLRHWNSAKAQEFKQIVEDTAANKFIVSLRCGGEAKTEHFPVRTR